MKTFDFTLDFEWNQGNKDKNWIKHKVLNTECEEVFFDNANIGYEDLKHSKFELRHIVLGQTKKGRNLQVSYTIRNNKIRVISVRDQSKKERVLYEQQKDKNKQ